MTKISVIVPVYNSSRYLDECLSSLVNQTFRDIEIICINDASTDNTLKILRNWEKKDKRIKIIDNPQNIKAGSARNIGMKVAVGEYLGFVDSDDYVSQDFYQSLINATNSNAEVVTSNLYLKFGNRTEEIRQFKETVDFNNQDSIKTSIAAFGCRLWTSLFKRTYVLNYNFQFTENVYFEDNAIVRCMFLLANHIAVVDNKSPLYFYRISPTSITNSHFSKKKLLDRLSTTEIMLNNFKKYKLFDTYKKEFTFCFYNIYYYNTLAFLLRDKKCSYNSIRNVYKKYIKIAEAFPSNEYVEKLPRFKFFNMVGKFPIIGRLYLMHRRFPLIRRIKQFIRKLF